MKRADLAELHNIAHLDNVGSIIKHGIFSYNLINLKGIEHQSIAMDEVQLKRDNKIIPGGRALHDYANAYICARNPMLFKRKSLYNKLCILRINPTVLDITGAVISTGNASSNYVAFYPANRGLEMIDENLVFAEYWTDQNLIAYYKKNNAKCAEVLVPDVIPCSLIFGAYVSCCEAEQHLNELAPTLKTEINPKIFFIK